MLTQFRVPIHVCVLGNQVAFVFLEDILYNKQQSVFIVRGGRSARREPWTFVVKTDMRSELELESDTSATCGIRNHNLSIDCLSVEANHRYFCVIIIRYCQISGILKRKVKH